MDETGDWVPPEDEYDALNDETFGDDSGTEFNWDEAQLMLDDFEKIKPNGNASKLHEENPVDFGSPEHDRLIDHHHHHGFQDKDSSKTFEDDFDNENALAESISRLMDDFDDDDDAEAMKSKLRRLGGTGGGSLNTYFLPPQVANKHHNWIGGNSSLLGSSVWSMHPTTTSTPDTDHVPAPSNHHHHTANTVNVRVAADHRPPLHFPDQFSHPTLPQSKLNDLSARSPKSQPPVKPVFKTVEEIERELLEGSDTPPFPPPPAATKPPTNHHHPLIMTAEELERQLMDDSSPPPPVVPSSPLKQPQQLPPPYHSTPPPPGLTAPDNNNGLRHHGGSPSLQKGSPRPPPGLTVNQLMILQQQRMQQHGTPPPLPPHMAGGHQFSPRGRMMMSPAQMHHHHQQVQFALHQQQQHMRMMQQMSPQMRSRMPPHMLLPFPHPPPPPGMGGGGHRPPFQGMGPLPPHQQMPPHFMRHFRSEDPYSGLMNEKDKQRLRNISIVQLQNDHPYTTDYYSLMYRVRRGNSDPKRQHDCLIKLFPNKSDDSSGRNNYQPAHFENSLGKLQAVSALAPKKAIDTVIRVVDAGQSNRGGMKAYRYLLLEIEKLYECLLKIQEGDIRKTILSNADAYTLQQRNENERKVKTVLLPQNKLAEILSVHKGKMLISRLMPLLEPEFRFQLLSHMITNFPDWGASKNSDIDRTYPFLRHCIISAKMKDLIFAFNGIVPTAVYECMITSKLGISLLMAAFHRGETIIQSSLPDDERVAYLNRLYIKEVDCLVRTVLRSLHLLATPIEFPANIMQHFARWGYTSDQLLQFESTLELWAKEGSTLLQFKKEGD